MKAIERLFQYIEYKNIRPSRLEKTCNLSNGYLKQQLKRKADMGESVLNNIIDNCQDLNPIWLLFDQGEMLKEEDTVIENHQTFDEVYWKDLVSSQQKTIERQAKTIEDQSNVIASLISQKDKRAV